jgi:translation initiation factor IF-1
MFEVDGEKRIHITRGDAVNLKVTATDEDGMEYIFEPGDVVRFKVFERKDCNCLITYKDAKVDAASDHVTIELTSKETRIGELINKPKDYWYEIELNPEVAPQTIVGYDQDGPKVLRLYPEATAINGTVL